MHPLFSGFVQIFGPSGSTVGSGFLSGAGYVCTCAHVCAQALGLPELKTSAVPPNEPIRIAFPFISTRQTYLTTVTEWSPDSPDGCDGALLSVRDYPPKARALPAASASNSTGAPFEVHGFQTGTSFDVSAKGRVGMVNIKGWMELVGESSQGFFVQPGFSGGPVWDVHRQACIGIIKAVAPDPSLRVAFLITTDLLTMHFRDNGTLAGRPIVFDRGRSRGFVDASRRYQTEIASITRYLSEVLRATEDPTERYWIYETLGDIGGSQSRAILVEAELWESDGYAKRGLCNALTNNS